MDLIAVCQFEIGELWIDGEMLGSTVEEEFEGHATSLLWPDKELQLPYKNHQRIQVGSHIIGGYVDDEAGNKKRVDVRQLMLLLWLVADEADLEEGAKWPGARNLSHATRHANNFGAQWLANYLDYCRTEGGQYRLGQSADWPILRNVTLLDAGTEDSINISASYMDAVTLGSLDGVVTKTHHVSFVQNATRGLAPDLADRLLADARHIARSQPAQAALLAAMACELKVKEILQRSASDAQSDLVQLLLENPRDWSMAASSLYDRPAKVVFGRSLREDDRPLWKRLNRLFEVRNDVAHRGGSKFTEADQLEAVESAVDTFKWLAGVLRE